MKAFTNQNPRTLDEAVSLAREALQAGQSVSFAGGGTDLLQLMKDRLVNRPGSGQPDVLVNLKTVDGLDEISSTAQGGMTIGGLTTLDTLTEHPVLGRRGYLIEPVDGLEVDEDVWLAGSGPINQPVLHQLK